MANRRPAGKHRPSRIPRRKFLIGAAAAVGVPYFVPASALGADGRAAPSERVTLGCIGVGNRGAGNLKTFLSRGDVQVLAVCDPHGERRAAAVSAVKAKYGARSAPRGYNDFRDLLARDDIDAVSICSNDHWHALHAIAAARAGKDVYCEKPLGTTIAEGLAMIAAVRRYGRIFQTGTQQRSIRNFRYACELARSGYLGRVHTVEVATPGFSNYVANDRTRYNATLDPVPSCLDYNLWLGPAPVKPFSERRCFGRPAGWFHDYDYSIGFIVNWGMHHLDVAHWGCPAVGTERMTIDATGKYLTTGLCNNAAAWRSEFRCAGGVRMCFSNTDNPHPQGTTFIGDEGRVHVSRRGISATPASLLRVQLKADDVHLYDSRNHHGNFIECVRTRHEPVAPVEAGHIASALGILPDIAAQLARTLTWDWKTHQFIGDDAANRMLTGAMRQPWNV